MLKIQQPSRNGLNNIMVLWSWWDETGLGVNMHLIALWYGLPSRKGCSMLGAPLTRGWTLSGEYEGHKTYEMGSIRIPDCCPSPISRPG